MKFNLSYPQTGAQKCLEVDDVNKFGFFFDRRIGQEVEIDALGDDYKGYVVKITGGNDKDGFSMKQGVLVKGRVRILMSKGHKCYRPRKSGERKRKSVRGCIVGSDICVLALSIVKKGEKDIAGLTDTQVARRLGPKRVAHIRKLYALKKEEKELVLKNVIRRKWTKKVGEKDKQRQKAPKVQRLVTAIRLRRKRIYKEGKKQKWRSQIEAAKTYHNLLVDLKKKEVEKKAEVKKQKEQQQGGDKKVDEKKPTDKKVADKKQDKKPVEKKAGDKKPAEKKPAEKKPAEKKPAEKKPAEKKPEEKKPADKKPAEKKQDKPAETKKEQPKKK